MKETLKDPQGKNKVWVVVSLCNVAHQALETGKASFEWIRIRLSCTTVFQTAYQVGIHQGQKLYRTKGTSFVASNDSEMGTDMAPCNHEKAAARPILQALHSATLEF